MKNSVNYSGFLDLVYSTGGEKTLKGVKQAPVHREQQPGAAVGVSSQQQRTVNSFNNININST